ncbi:hypothetical protein Flavo103_10570 [Flavobacterium collinsii]|uniref:hypothetical protein n=1 Tax=Flavobacterium collinsii TaxID=1114861 RepID=UPI0022BE62A6|nr:hypothetical protein [Flavobacterium collinsii]GIQ57921.1 hypothetical protein Flavo103_10570 [Flavobacterium collinsii]
MKNILKTSALIFLFLTFSCSAQQQMVQTTKDAFKLKENEQHFINKPLKYLLKEIKPEIKLGYANNDEGHSYFGFKFTTLLERKKNEKSNDREDRVSLYVYVKEAPIDWDFDKRPKGKEYEWTKKDIEKYGNLTVIRIKVIQPIED